MLGIEKEVVEMSGLERKNKELSGVISDLEENIGIDSECEDICVMGKKTEGMSDPAMEIKDRVIKLFSDASIFSY